MKPRTIRTCKILVAAIGVTACEKTAEAPRAEVVPKPETANVAPVAAPADHAPTATVAAAAAETSPPPPAARERKDDTKLLGLRDELDATTIDDALARRAHFMPLCDREGYPLVGNVIRKGPTGAQPSTFCARAKK